MILKYPLLLLLFLVFIPLIWWWFSRKRNASPSIGISSLTGLAQLPTTWKEYCVDACFWLQLGALGCLIVAICRPQVTNSKTTSTVEGTDIVIALDISTSMSASDLQPNRFEAARTVAQNFVKGRPDDNIGLVAFGGESLSLMPLTQDKSALIGAIGNLAMGELDNGTAIGDGLASAINRLVSGQARSKSVILLTDGTNNTGEVAPSTAAEIAKSKGIKVYTIGVGTDQAMQITDPYGFTSTTVEAKIDEKSLKSIAKTTGGKYFRALDEQALRHVFQEIDTLEKTKLDVSKYSRMDENFMPWVWAALVCYVVMLTMRYVVLRKIP